MNRCQHSDPDLGRTVPPAGTDPHVVSVGAPIRRGAETVICLRSGWGTAAGDFFRRSSAVPVIAAILFASVAFCPFGASREARALLMVILVGAFGALCGLRMIVAHSDSSARAATESRLFPFLLGTTVLAALLLRIWHLDFGFPNFYHPDEGPKGEIVARMLARGSLNPHYFLHPTLLLYLSAIVSRGFELLGIRDDPTERCVLAGRLVSALAGTFSVFLVGCIGRRLVSSAGGVLSALILALSPLHVTCSRYMKEDVLFLTFVLATVAVLLRGLDGAAADSTESGSTKSEATRLPAGDARTRRGWLLASGFLAGCATGSKYTGALAVLLVVLIPFLWELHRDDEQKLVGAIRRYPLKTVFAALVAVPFGFLCTTPYALLDSGAFLRHFRVEQRHMESGHQGIAIDAWSQWWMYHLTRSLVPGMGVIGTVFGIAGIGLLLITRSFVGQLLFLLVLLLYLPGEWVKAKPPPQAERYVLGVVPFLSLAAAGFVVHLARARMKTVAVLLALLMVVPIGFRSATLARDLVPDTRRLMREWMVDNLPPKTRILIDAAYSPRLGETSFRVRLSKVSRRPENFTVSRLREVPEEYLLVNSFSYDRHFREPRVNPLLQKRFRRIFESFELVREFRAPTGSYGFHNPVVRLYRLHPAEPGAGSVPPPGALPTQE